MKHLNIPGFRRLEEFIRHAGDGELIGRSRLDAAYLGERARCAGVVDKYREELMAWTAEDDHGLDLATQRAVSATLLEAARRIRAQGQQPAAGARVNTASATGRPRPAR